MAGYLRLFEVSEAGLFVEVPPDRAARLRAERRLRHLVLVAEVLFTPEEEAQRDAEERALQSVAQADADPSTAEVSSAAAAIAELTAKVAALEAKIGVKADP